MGGVFMSDRTRLDATIKTALGFPEEADIRGIGYGRTEGWDSIGHMQLVLAIEEAFGITLSPDDVFAMSDYPAVHEVLDDRLARPIEG
jgi:acyl carrier protein